MEQKDFILITWPFLLLSFLYCIIGLTVSKFYGDIELHLLLNKYNALYADYFFRYYTKVGEWFFGIPILILIIYRHTWRFIAIFLTGCLLQLILIQGIKRAFFIDHLRPAYYFQNEGVPLYLIDGVKQGITFSFPSGHTATGFFLFCFLALLIKHNGMKLLCGVAAILVAYSRIYLSQHFMLDTIAGALIGIFCVIFSYYIWYYLKSPMLDKKIKDNKKSL